MKTITFIRHAQSVANAGGITMEHDLIPLTTIGQMQSSALASALDVKPSKVFVSKYFRTQETAKPFCEKLGVTPSVHPLLHEFSTFDPILLKDMTGEQRQPLVEDYWRHSDPEKRMGRDAETFKEFNFRVGTFIDETHQIPDQSVLFGHGMWLSLLIWKLFGFSSDDSVAMKSFRRFQLGFPMPNCAVYDLKHSQEGLWWVKPNEAVMRSLALIK